MTFDPKSLVLLALVAAVAACGRPAADRPAAEPVESPNGSSPEVTYEPAYPAEVSEDALDAGDAAQQRGHGRDHGDHGHGHGPDADHDPSDDDHSHGPDGDPGHDHGDGDGHGG